MRVLFMGSPEFAIPSLSGLIEDHEVVGVVTQPDRPAGRGRKTHQPAVKQLALHHRIPVLQPERVRDSTTLEQISALRPELIIVAAYGQILPQELLDLPTRGCLNVHASLLPRWRGAAPIQAALLAGDAQTGVTIMVMDAGLDTGPILSQRSVPVPSEATAGSLSSTLAQLGAELLIETIPPYLGGQLLPIPQDDAQATAAPLLRKSDGQLEFGQTAERLARQIRAFDPWPGSYTFWQQRRLAVKQAHASDSNQTSPGQVRSIQHQPAVGTSQGLLVLDRVQLAGRREASGVDFVRGAPDFVGSTLPS